MIVTSLNRYAVKGLSGDALTSVELHWPGETFPDDRRFALLRRQRGKRKDDEEEEQQQQQQRGAEFRPGTWLHKENFLCAFTEPELLSRLKTSYSIQSSVPSDETTGDGQNDDNIPIVLSRAYPNDAAPVTNSLKDGTGPRVRRLLTVRDRRSGILLMPTLDLSLREHRNRLQDFLSDYSRQEVVCVTADDYDLDRGSTSSSEEDFTSFDRRHLHQFGNTSSGYKQRGDTRTVHIVSQQTVDALSDAIVKNGGNGNGNQSGAPRLLRPGRFRPNIVVDCGPDFPPFGEFEWVGRRVRVAGADDASADTSAGGGSGLVMSVISKTVRCRGVSVDPEDDPPNVLDIPDLLVRHFPMHGPYLGVYAVIDNPGRLSVNDRLELAPLN
jgi:uncharacterized protein YcbX